MLDYKLNKSSLFCGTVQMLDSEDGGKVVRNSKMSTW